MNYQGGNLSEYAGKKHIYNRFKYIIEELRARKGTILVIGSGDGSFERHLKETNPALSITSIDLNEEFRNKFSGVSDTIIIDDFLTHDFYHTFDYLVSVDVIEHILDTDAFLVKARELLTDDGYFYLQTPNVASWHGRLCLLFGFIPEAMEVSMFKSYFGKFWIFRHENSILHVRIFTYRALREMCTYYGFKIERAVGIDYRIPSIFKLFPGIAGSVCLKLKKQVSAPRP